LLHKLSSKIVKLMVAISASFIRKIKIAISISYAA
jgi:hypothetical protein